VKKYRFVDDLTSDVMFEAYGKDLAELFANAAEAMFSVICKLDRISPEKKISVSVEGKNEKDLLFNWLQELIGLVDTEGMFLSEFRIRKIEGNAMEAEVKGEEMVPEKGETVVKAVTYYGLSLEKTESGYKAVVSLDI